MDRISDTHLDSLRRKVIKQFSGGERPDIDMTLIYRLVTELQDAREELEDLRLLLSINEILAEELDDGPNTLAITWLDEDYVFSLRPRSQSTIETQRLPKQATPHKTNYVGRRLRRID